jgi:hypothetical protein
MFFEWGQKNSTMTSKWSVARVIVRRICTLPSVKLESVGFSTLGPPASADQFDRTCRRFTPESEMHEAILLIERMSAAVSIIGGDNPEDRHCMGACSGFRC